jgi:hypothetical protein
VSVAAFLFGSVETARLERLYAPLDVERKFRVKFALHLRAVQPWP